MFADGIILDAFFFFFQAEDGIRYATVTGVQTCALPISAGIGVTDQQDVGQRASQGDCQYRTPLPRSFHSLLGFSPSVRPKLVPGGSCRPRPSVSGKSFASSSGSSLRSASTRRIGSGRAISV